MYQKFIIFFSAFFIGLLLVFIILKKKKTEFNYLPNIRVINDIKNSDILISEKINLTESYFRDTLLKKAKVIFHKSKIRGEKEPIYLLEIDNKNIKLKKIGDTYSIFSFEKINPLIDKKNNENN